MFSIPLLLLTAAVHCVCCNMSVQKKNKPWNLYIIGDSSTGADGVRLEDINDDGQEDIVTGWEEGGEVFVYCNPGPMKAKEKWPAVAAGRVNNVEDAVAVDLDSDGVLDIVSSCEGKTKNMYVHWAPENKSDYLISSAWTTGILNASRNEMQWMFCIPMQVDGSNGIDLVAGGKNENAQIGWFEAPVNPRNLLEWKWHPISKAGWIMSIIAYDMDDDNDLDIVVSDRKGTLRGCRWLENPGHGSIQFHEWKNHFIGGRNKEVMFMTIADLDGDTHSDILAASKPHELLYFRRTTTDRPTWESITIPLPKKCGTAKAVKVADIDMDGLNDIVFSCENSGGLSGVMWLSFKENASYVFPEGHDISGTRGTKFDILETIDLDGDGDLDVITCEETENLGVVWYENPVL